MLFYRVLTECQGIKLCCSFLGSSIFPFDCGYFIKEKKGIYHCISKITEKCSNSYCLEFLRMEKGKPKGTEEIQHMSLLFRFYIHLHLAAWIRLPDLWINIVYLLSDYSVNKVMCSTKALLRLKHAKLLVGRMAKWALCEDTLFCCGVLSEDIQSWYSS